MHTRYNPYPQFDADDYQRRAEIIHTEMQLAQRAIDNLNRVLGEHLPHLAKHHASRKPLVQRLFQLSREMLRKAARDMNDGPGEAWRTALLDIDTLRTEEFSARHAANLKEQRRLRELEVFTDEKGQQYQIRERDTVDPNTGRAMVETRRVYVTHDDIMRQQEAYERSQRTTLL